jgi:hypothetical protein
LLIVDRAQKYTLFDHIEFDMAVKFSGVCTGHVLEELVLIKFKNFFVDQLVPLAFGVRPYNLRICIDGQKLEKLQSVLYVMEPRLRFVRGVEIRQSMVRQSIWI